MLQVGEGVQGQGRPRRFINTADKLVERPSDDINVIADILARSATKYPKQKAVGWREVIKVHSEQKDVKKRVDQLKKDGKKSVLLLVSNADGELRLVALSVQ